MNIDRNSLKHAATFLKCRFYKSNKFYHSLRKFIYFTEYTREYWLSYVYSVSEISPGCNAYYSSWHKVDAQSIFDERICDCYRRDG